MSVMSNSIKPLKLENVLDPRLNAMDYVQDKIRFGVMKGTENQNVTRLQANSYSTSGINWSFNTQSENVLIDRRIYAQVQFQISFTGTSTVGQPLLALDGDAPRAFPLASITNSLKVTINGTSVESQYSDNMLAMLRYNNDFQLSQYDLSQTPNYPDTYQNYADGVGAIRNPLASYGSSGDRLGRGSFQLDAITNPVSVDGVTPTTSIIKFTVVEPLIVSPLLYSCTNLEAGFIGVRNMSVQFNFVAGQLDRIWSHAINAGSNITSTNVQLGAGVTEPPVLSVTYLTPPLIDIGLKPKTAVYQYYKTDTNINDMNVTLSSGASQTFASNSMQVPSVPRSIFIYACLKNGDKNYTTTDSFFRINSISLQYLNTSGQFSSMNSHDLYSMSVKNGLQMSWTEWNGETSDIGAPATFGLCGSVLKIDVDDLAIPSNLAPSVSVNSQLNYTINITNTNSSVNKSVQLVTIFVYDGIMEIQDNNVVTQTDILNQYDVVKIRAKGEWVDYHSAKSLYGGNWFSKLASLGRKGFEGFKKTCDLSKQFGLGGASAGASAGAIVGGKRCPKGSRKECKKGGELYLDEEMDQEPLGGRMMSRAELKKRLMM